MTVQQIMTELKSRGDEQIKKIFLKHGVKEPFFGVRIEYLKAIQKKIKTDYKLALDLYATGNADAMYLAGLITDDASMTKADLQTWVKQAVSNNISEYTVPWVASGSRHGYELGMRWINAKEDHIVTAGWATLGGWVATRPDEALDLPAIKDLLQKVKKEIHGAPNRVRYTMNNFVICVGSYVKPLTADAMATAAAIGEVTVNMNGTACKVPSAAEYIQKVRDKGKWGVKKKTMKC